MDINLKQNLGRIIRSLEEQGMKPTKIAHSIGYTTTRQLYNAIEGQSMLSTKAIKGLIENLNVNPMYLFLGKGEMFLSDESEIETLRKKNQELLHKHSEAVKTVLALNSIIMKLEKRNNDLIELSSAAIKYHQGHKQPTTEKEEETDLWNNPALDFMKRFKGKDSMFDLNGNLNRKNVFSPELLSWLEQHEKEEIQKNEKSIKESDD